MKSVSKPDPELLANLKFESTVDEDSNWYGDLLLSIKGDYYEVGPSSSSFGTVQILRYQKQRGRYDRKGNYVSAARNKPSKDEKLTVIDDSNAAAYGMSVRGCLERVMTTFTYEDFLERYKKSCEAWGFPRPENECSVNVSKYEMPILMNVNREDRYHLPLEVTVERTRMSTKWVAASQARKRLPKYDKLYLNQNGVAIIPLPPILEAIRKNVNLLANPLAWKESGGSKFLILHWAGRRSK